MPSKCQEACDAGRRRSIFRYRRNIYLVVNLVARLDLTITLGQYSTVCKFIPKP